MLTDVGYKDIEDIRVGDKVLTHNNRYMPVLAIGHKEAMTYTLKRKDLLMLSAQRIILFTPGRNIKNIIEKTMGKSLHVSYWEMPSG